MRTHRPTVLSSRREARQCALLQLRERVADGVEVGQFALGEVMWSRWRRKSEPTSKTDVLNLSTATKDVQMTDASPDKDLPQQSDSEMGQDGTGTKQIALDPLLRDEVAPIQDFMETLELEASIQELLGRNKQALARLEELQSQRLGGENGGASQVEVGSEEWDIGECPNLRHILPS